MRISKLGLYSLFIFIFILWNCVFAEDLCECSEGRNYPEVKRLIAMLKEKSDRIRTIQMDLTLITEKNEYVTEPLSNINFSFIMSENNYVLIYTRPAKEVILDNSKKEVNAVDTDRPQNSLESWLINRYKEKQKNNKPLSYYDFYTEYNYFYNNKYAVYSIFSKGEEQKVEARKLIDIETPPIFIFEDPRIFVGKGGIKDAGIKNREDKSLSLIEFLEKDGIYCYKGENEYRKIWHMSRLEDNFQLEMEFHIDSHDNLIKVKEVMRPFWRFGNIEKKEIEEILGKKVSCDYPEKVIYEIIFSDFHPDWNIPLKMEKLSYDYILPDNKKIDWETIYQKYEQGKLSYQKFIGYYHLFFQPIIKKRVFVLINKESLKINEPIDESTFISPVKPPEETLEETEKQSRFPWYRRYTGVIFVGGCIAFTLILMFLTRRYLGWGM